MSESKPSLKWALPGAGGLASKRGFSAIEVTAVAAIIFVLALVLVPIVNKRVEEAKKTSCEEDLVAIEKAEQLAFGYTGHYYRLCDLDRPEPQPGDANAAYKVPPAYWNGLIMMQTETNFLINNWKGPFLPGMHKERSMVLTTMLNTRPDLVNCDQVPSGAGNVAGAQGGPIFLCDRDDIGLDGPTPPAYAFSSRTYPIDPWGNPYIFFGPGFYGTPSSNAVQHGQNQYNYPTAVVYSLGPDGIAASAANYTPPGRTTTPADYYREANLLGLGDDLKREF